MRSVAALFVAAILATTPAPGPWPQAPAGRLPPGPLVVESAPGSPAGVLRIEPGVARLRAASGESVQPELIIINGADGPLDLVLAVTSVAPAPDGAPTLAEPTRDADSTAPSAAPWLALPASSLHLDPGEQARLRPTISVPALAEPGGYVAALRAATRPGFPGTEPSRRLRRLPADAPPADLEVVAFILVDVPAVSSEDTRRVAATAALTRSGLAAVEARVRLEAEQSEVVAGRLKVDGWWGASLLDVAIPPTVVLPAGPRTQQVGFRAPLLPGPYHLVASLETSAGETLSVGATAWLWNPLATLIVLLAVLLVAAAAVTRVAARRRS